MLMIERTAKNWFCHSVAPVVRAFVVIEVVVHLVLAPFAAASRDCICASYIFSEGYDC